MTAHRMSVLGAVMLVVGVLAVVANEAALSVFPTHWGGPNVLAGLINLVAGLLAVAGLVVVAVGWWAHRER